jgi:hypothetical protein
MTNDVRTCPQPYRPKHVFIIIIYYFIFIIHFYYFIFYKPYTVLGINLTLTSLRKEGELSFPRPRLAHNQAIPDQAFTFRYVCHSKKRAIRSLRLALQSTPTLTSMGFSS